MQHILLGPRQAAACPIVDRVACLIQQAQKWEQPWHIDLKDWGFDLVVDQVTYHCHEFSRQESIDMILDAYELSKAFWDCLEPQEELIS